MKNLLILVLSICTILPANAGIITGGIEYNTNSAREELNRTEPVKIPEDLLYANIKDKNRDENLSNLLKGETELVDRTLAYFSDGSYGVIYKKDTAHVWYYNNRGELTHAEVKNSLKYPYKTYKYSKDNRLVNMSLRISKNETYIFNPDGKLIARWLGKYCYDKNNNIVMSRKILE